MFGFWGKKWREEWIWPESMKYFELKSRIEWLGFGYVLAAGSTLPPDMFEVVT